MLYGHDQGKNIKQLCDGTNDIVCAKMGGTGKASHTANAVLTGNGEDAVKNVATANGAFYATAANGAPKFGTLPIAQGGTGKTTAADALNALGGVSFKKLWENAKPSNAFVKQTISIALSDYDAVMIENCLFNNYTDRRIAQMFLIGKEGYMSQALQYIVWRMISIKSTGISFEQGQNTYQFNATSADNTACIPTRIWGVKF